VKKLRDPGKLDQSEWATFSFEMGGLIDGPLLGGRGSAKCCTRDKVLVGSAPTIQEVI
jgi:hypothetical protein